MKIQCDVCEKAPATVICCADEAALCSKCDTEVHAANKLASKHQRLVLQSLSNKLPPCDICQEKAAFIFCVEDRALFCRDCDQPIHSSGSLAANHQRFLATGIRVALNSNPPQEAENHDLNPPAPPPSPPPLNKTPQNIPLKTPTQQDSGFSSPSWAVDDLLQFSDFESSDKVRKAIYTALPFSQIKSLLFLPGIRQTKGASHQRKGSKMIENATNSFEKWEKEMNDLKEQLEFGELDWLTEIGMFGDQVAQETLAAAEVPQLQVSSQSSPITSYRPNKNYTPNKKSRIEISDNDDDHFTVPDFTVPDLG
ncbi:hypothetical protein LguiA_002886 [Lonicera macranthoides]